MRRGRAKPDADGSRLTSHNEVFDDVTGLALPTAATARADEVAVDYRVNRDGDFSESVEQGTITIAMVSASSAETGEVYVSTAENPTRTARGGLSQNNGWTFCATNPNPCDAGALAAAGIADPATVRWVVFGYPRVEMTDAAPRRATPGPGVGHVDVPCVGTVTLVDRGSVVWSRTLSSLQYGSPRGDLSYVGPCDAAANPNAVTLTIDGLYDATGELIPSATWRNPTPIIRGVICDPNADVEVAFNLFVARSATQGFFDVAVSFADVFCPAKLDCVDALLHKPGGSRAETVVVAFACTSGQGETTWLHQDGVVLSCSDGTVVTTNHPSGPGPQVTWNVQVIDNGELVCGAHPLDVFGSGVATGYPDAATPTQYAYSMQCVDAPQVAINGYGCAGSVAGVSTPVVFAATDGGVVVSVGGRPSAPMALPEGVTLEGCCADGCCTDP
jgi:hypothetical protein